MNNRPSYRVFTYTLAAGETIDIHRQANTLVCLASSARFEVGFGTDPVTEFESGLSYTAEEAFNKVALSNPSDAEIILELGFASGGISDSRLSLTGAVQANIRGGQNLVSGAVMALEGTATKLIDAKANRLEVLITNMGNNPVFIGGSNVQAFEGLPIAGGLTAQIQTSAELYAYNQSSAAIKLSYLEISS